ncbi:tRNA pseudouridine(38-40) synthase TruA [Sandarakinorhabdus sp. AAP62]|uniref:tRNA pseudouridine(38-40) synthase TruA n=1 Tax=Sandarakinorhabdus sp. AAP62 TaxID=1248916 RepID=UPI00031F65DA|nr:tRNA pseudouridine(38-40) synthase TruA [Sandarakinorhabdus sp. AAP62]
MTRFRFTVEYDGRPFMGWQRQAHGPSVQGAIAAAIMDITGETVEVFASGRTDAGVHAHAMPAHADIEKTITPFRLMEAINARLKPQPVAILDCAEAPDWHARFDCTGRRYRYRIVNRRAPLTFDAGLAWRVPTPLDADAMHAAAQRLVGRHDFTTFRSAQCQASSPLRTLDRLDVTRIGEEIHVVAAARSFLHHQVRSMVGCLKMVGSGQWSADDLAAALAARDRDALGLNAPPDGLYFVGAIYPKLSVGFTL